MWDQGVTPAVETVLFIKLMLQASTSLRSKARRLAWKGFARKYFG